MKNRKRKLERNLEICSMRAAGLTYKEIAQRHNISIIRVRQILEAYTEAARC